MRRHNDIDVASGLWFLETPLKIHCICSIVVVSPDTRRSSKHRRKGGQARLVTRNRDCNNLRACHVPHELLREGCYSTFSIEVWAGRNCSPRKKITPRLTGSWRRRVAADADIREVGASWSTDPFDWSGLLSSAVSHSQPIFTSIRDFDYETAIWDVATCNSAQKRLAEVLLRQWNVIWDPTDVYSQWPWQHPYSDGGCPFSAARTGRTGRRLIGEFCPGGTSREPNSVQILSPARGFWLDPQEIWDFLAGGRTPLQRRPFQLHSGVCRLGRLPGVGRRTEEAYVHWIRRCLEFHRHSHRPGTVCQNTSRPRLGHPCLVRPSHLHRAAGRNQQQSQNHETPSLRLPRS